MYNSVVRISCSVVRIHISVFCLVEDILNVFSAHDKCGMDQNVNFSRFSILLKDKLLDKNFCSNLLIKS